MKRHSFLIIIPLMVLVLLACGNNGTLSSPVVATPALLEASLPSPTEPASTPSVASEGTVEAPPTTQPEPPTAEQAWPELAAVRLVLRPVADKLNQPVGLANAGDGSGRLFVVEKQGTIRIVVNGALNPIPYLDISDRVGSSGSEQGLLGLAFHPDYTENGYFFVNYTNRNGNTVISRFQVTSDPDRADPDSELVVLKQEQPAANHNGGNLVFGPDGYLYIGLGDGGAANDRFGNAQNGQTLLGAMLRIEVGGDLPYTVPPDNPFVNDPTVRDEIWAIGLRNPWRYSFDRLTGDLYIADVGQNAYEEVSFQPANSPGGENYGWPIMEGFHCFNPPQGCDSSGLTMPIIEYDHSLGCSITGGHVYRGRAFPSLNGIYFFGDYCSGRIWGLARDQSGAWQARQLAQHNIRLSAFGEDEAGELYVLDMGSGTLFQLTAE